MEDACLLRRVMQRLGWKLDNPGLESQQRQRFFSSLKVQTGYGAHPES